MRLLAAVVLLTGSLAGCVGDFTSERIEGRYHRCLDGFKPLAGVSAEWWEKQCDDLRAADYDYRLSARRLVPTFPSSPGGGPPPTQVIILNP